MSLTELRLALGVTEALLNEALWLPPTLQGRSQPAL